MAQGYHGQRERRNPAEHVHITKNAQIDGKQAINEMKQEANKEIHERKQELQNQERSLNQREQNIDRRDAALLAKENALDEKNETLSRRLKDMDRKEAQLQEKIDSIIAELEKVAQMSTQEAREELFNRVESKVSKEIAAFIKQKEEEAKEECDTRAKELLGLALTRYAQDVTSERTVSVVALPSDEMKGRIIGREGERFRNDYSDYAPDADGQNIPFIDAYIYDGPRSPYGADQDLTVNKQKDQLAKEKENNYVINTDRKSVV